MSTKIYVAWRCKVNDFGDVLDSLRRQGMAYAERTMRAACRTFTSKEIDEAAKTLAARYGRNVTLAFHRAVRLRCALALAARSSESPLRGTTPDIDCSLNVWVHKGRVYMIGYGDCWFVGGDTFLPASAEDYSYWNNVDRPASVSAAAWAARKRTWSAVCLDGGSWDENRMVHTIIDAKNGTGLAELVRIMLPKENVNLVLP